MPWFHAGPTVENIDTVLNPDHVTDVQRRTGDDGQMYIHVWMSAGGTAVRRNIFGSHQAEAVWQWAIAQTGVNTMPDVLDEVPAPTPDMSDTPPDEASLAEAARLGGDAARNALRSVKRKQ